MNRFLREAWVLTALLALLPTAVSAAGYQIGEDTPHTAPGPKAAGEAGPIRLVWFSFVQGDVSWRAADGAAWSPASVNLPLRQGGQIRVASGGRAELQFDDGSLLRLGHGATATLDTLHSDEDGEVTELDLPEGLASLELRGTPSVYQIDTPLVSVKSEGPSKVRVGVDSSVEIAVRQGNASVKDGSAEITLHSGDYLNVLDASSAANVHLLPDEDRWDHFNDDRDRQLADAESAVRLPPDIARVAGSLTAYGSWHDDLRYGAVWCPRETDADWRPYLHGRWVWVEPFGRTWVSDEAWGWAPYHYGTWVSEPYGWAWVPGPAQQYWCPAVVGFSEEGDEVAWAPLAPSEVHYPVYLAHCYGGGDWAQFFSIGGAAVYYPDDGSYCDPRPFNNETVNRGVTVAAPSIPALVHRPVTGTIVDRYIHHPAKFVPINSRRAAGATVASTAEFGGAGRGHPQASDGGAFWARGRSTRAPIRGQAPVSGPAAVRPAAPFLPPLPSGFPGAAGRERPIFRAPLPDRAVRLPPPPSQASARFIPPVFVRPAATGAVRQNVPEARQDSAQPASVRPPDSARIRIILPRETPAPGGPVATDTPRDDPRRNEAGAETTTVPRVESRPERPAPRPEERPQEQHPQEQHSPPAAGKQDTKQETKQDNKSDDKQDNKSDDKKDNAGDQAERRGGRAR